MINWPLADWVQNVWKVQTICYQACKSHCQKGQKPKDILFREEKKGQKKLGTEGHINSWLLV